jgi:hypothetical protein
MTGQIRPEVVAQVRAELDQVDERFIEEKLAVIGSAGLTDAEKLAIALMHASSAVGNLRAAEVLRDPPSLLSLTYRELIAAGAQGHALLWLADQLAPSWASRWQLTLADVLKIESPKRVAYFARKLRHAGIHDLDELSPPDLDV